jgi:AcrR family transcriptional regulator
MKHEKDENLERLILDTAERLFSEKGFAMTSTVEIAKLAGCNQALVHYYFRSKENLFQTIFAKKIRLVISTFLEGNEETLTFEEKLEKQIIAHFEMVRSNPRLPFLVITELTVNPSRLQSIKDRIIDLPLSFLKQLNKELQLEIENGRIRSMSIYDIALTIVSLNAMLFLVSPILKSIAEMSDAEFEELVEHRKKEHVRIILASLKP